MAKLRVNCLARTMRKSAVLLKDEELTLDLTYDILPASSQKEMFTEN